MKSEEIFPFAIKTTDDDDAIVKDTRKGVQSVDLAFAIMRVLEAAERALAVKEIADRLDMPSSKVHHYLVSLVRSRVLRQTSEGRYDLGVFALHLGLSALRRLDPIERSTQAARTLRDLTGEAVFIAVWGSHGPTTVRFFDGFQPITVEIRAGHVLPLVTSATGRVFLAWGHPSQIGPFLERETNFTDQDRQNLQARTKEAGLGVVEGHLLPRIAAFSAPVFDRDNRLVAAITMLGWVDNFDTRLDCPNAIALKEAAANLSVELGYNERLSDG